MDILQKLVRVHPPATSVFKKITFDDKKPLAIFYDNTKPAASDYVSGPFGPGKIYQKQPAVSCATCGIRPAALHYYVMQYVKKCSYHSNITYYNSLIAPTEVFVLALCQAHPSHFLLPLYLQLCLIHFLMHLIRTQRIPYCFG